MEEPILTEEQNRDRLDAFFQVRFENEGVLPPTSRADGSGQPISSNPLLDEFFDNKATQEGWNNKNKK